MPRDVGGEKGGEMEQDMEGTLAILSRTPAALDALLRGLAEEWTRANEGEGTWSAFDVVVHLIHCEEADWMPRVRTILEHGEAQEFAPLDRWGGMRESQSRPLEELLDEFARRRAESLEALRKWRLNAEDFARQGRHPALGVVTLGELLATWAAHDLNHLHQISRVMAHQYREAVGPWRQYLGVLRCDGHGG